MSLARCPWVPADDALYRAYHDEEWGRSVHGDQPLFERISLEAFQAGLSWRVVLAKRPAFREAFDGFDPVLVAGKSDRDLELLMDNDGIVRNRAKIVATRANATALLRLLEGDGEGALDRLVWSYAPPAGPAPRTSTDVPTRTTASTALARGLRTIGFRFVGPTTAYALMQACGLVDDHLVDCAFRGNGASVRPPRAG